MSHNIIAVNSVFKRFTRRLRSHGPINQSFVGLGVNIYHLPFESLAASWHKIGYGAVSGITNHAKLSTVNSCPREPMNLTESRITVPPFSTCRFSRDRSQCGRLFAPDARALLPSPRPHRRCLKGDAPHPARDSSF